MQLRKARQKKKKVIRVKELKCKNCVPPVRHIGCHDTCKDYQDWKKEQDELKAKLRKKALFDKWAIEDIRKRSRRK